MGETISFFFVKVAKSKQEIKEQDFHNSKDFQVESQVTEILT